MYVSVKGGEKAINNAHSWLSEIRRGDVNIPELNIKQINEQLTLSVDRVMSEGSLYDKDLSALAIKQSRGDLIEAIFLIRAYRTTLPRIGSSNPIDTSKMLCLRRISATFKDIPGKQKLGPTFDYTHRLLDFKLLADGEYEKAKIEKYDDKEIPHVLSFLNKEGLIQKEIPSGKTSKDITRNPINFPLTRSERLQSLSRGDEGFLLGLAYSTQRGYARNHAFVGELRTGYVEVQFEIPELGIEINIADVMFTECESVNQFKGSKKIPAQFTRGYGLVFGQLERKAISMALVDRSMRWKEFGEEYLGVAAQDEEFVISHCDNIQATGFLEHIKLPHYVDFQAELDLVRKIREEYKNNEQRT